MSWKIQTKPNSYFERKFEKWQLTWLRNQVNADQVIEDFCRPAHRDQVVTGIRAFLEAG